LILAIVLALAATPATAKRSAQPGFAEPGDIIATEGAMARLAAAKTMKAAFQATAAAGAEIFAPQLMRMPEFVKIVPDNQLAKDWHTRQVWMSCDGSYGVSYGEWRMPPALGWYVMIWQRQKGGAYKWVLNENGPLAAPLPDSDMISASVGDCPVRRGRGNTGASPNVTPTAQPALPDYTSHHADDGTMAWTTAVAADNSQTFSLMLKQDGTMREVLQAGATKPGH
jgi:hypothetical protein